MKKIVACLIIALSVLFTSRAMAEDRDAIRAFAKSYAAKQIDSNVNAVWPMTKYDVPVENVGNKRWLVQSFFEVPTTMGRTKKVHYSVIVIEQPGFYAATDFKFL